MGIRRDRVGREPAPFDSPRLHLSTARKPAKVAGFLAVVRLTSGEKHTILYTSCELVIQPGRWINTTCILALGLMLIELYDRPDCLY